jgi:DNA-binding Lrp family transcriptional regulator
MREDDVEGEQRRVDHGEADTHRLSEEADVCQEVHARRRDSDGSEVASDAGADGCAGDRPDELDGLGYPLTAIVRVKPVGGQTRRIQELAAQIPEVGECHRITGEDCFYLKVHLRSIDVLGELLDRFLAYGETTTSIINASPVPGRSPPPVAE